MDRAQKGLRVFTGRISDTAEGPFPHTGNIPATFPTASLPPFTQHEKSPRWNSQAENAAKSTRLSVPLHQNLGSSVWKATKEMEAGPAHGMVLRDQMDPWPQAPAHSSAIACGMPVVSTPSSSHISSSPAQRRLSPKAHLLKLQQHELLPPSPRQWVWAPTSLGHVSPAVSKLAGSGAHASRFSGSLQRTQQQGMRPRCPNFPLSPPPTRVACPITPPCVLTCTGYPLAHACPSFPSSACPDPAHTWLLSATQKDLHLNPGSATFYPFVKWLPLSKALCFLSASSFVRWVDNSYCTGQGWKFNEGDHRHHMINKCMSVNLKT